jgi:hypothetical protein
MILFLSTNAMYRKFLQDLLKAREYIRPSKAAQFAPLFSP